MVRIYSPDRAELQDAFANKFKRIVKDQAKRNAFMQELKEVLFLIALVFFSVALVYVLSVVCNLGPNQLSN